MNYGFVSGQLLWVESLKILPTYNPETLMVQDVFAMTESPTKILTQWNRNNQPVGDSSSLLAGFLGQVASNFGNFPMLYESWTHVPEQYKNNVYVNTIQANFVVNDVEHKQYILGSLGKKWKDKRCRLFDKFHNWEQSVEENIQNHPPHIPQDHWAIFVRYRRSAKTMEIANKNAANRAKLVIPHSLGSKTLARKRNELEMMHGREFNRAEMYQVSHKKPDGSFVNEEARELHVAEVDVLKQQIVFLMQRANRDQTPDLESPINKRSSEGSHIPEGPGGDSPATI
ncbi:hypothetical protein Fmac_008252 [Flemingia macrophylla]|uniref:Uncharacterized protein n=1 Tax=Flemingia macrophylla TaxID=520843 RepID=A0ABD1MWV6_9FABA